MWTSHSSQDPSVECQRRRLLGRSVSQGVDWDDVLALVLAIDLVLDGMDELVCLGHIGRGGEGLEVDVQDVAWDFHLNPGCHKRCKGFAFYVGI